MTGAILSVLARERTKSNDESNSITHTQWRPFPKEGPPRKAESLQRLNAARRADEKALESYARYLTRRDGSWKVAPDIAVGLSCHLL